MARTTMAFLSSVLLFAGCATFRTEGSLPAQTGQINAVQPAPETPAAAPMIRVVPPGKAWQNSGQPDGLSGFVLKNAETKAVVTVVFFPAAERSLDDAAAEMTTRFLADGRSVGELDISDRAKRVSFDWSGGDQAHPVKGRVVIWKVSAAYGASAMAIGFWPLDKDAAMSADLEAIVSSVEIK